MRTAHLSRGEAPSSLDVAALAERAGIALVWMTCGADDTGLPILTVLSADSQVMDAALLSAGESWTGGGRREEKGAKRWKWKGKAVGKRTLAREQLGDFAVHESQNLL